MDVRAAVAFEAGRPLTIETVQLDGPQAGEVLVEIKATGICHPDKYTLSGPIRRAVSVHSRARRCWVVVDVGAGVKVPEDGDHVIPLYTPECRECKSCVSHKTNLCTAIRATQGKGLMPDGSSRFSHRGKPVLHYMAVLLLRITRCCRRLPWRKCVTMHLSTRSVISAAASPPAWRGAVHC